MIKELPASSTLSHYRIVSKIGAGGMGEVYLAQDSNLDRRVALKILPEEFAQDTERMRRFVQEAKSASALNHPNIITIYEIGNADGVHFIATEYVEGETLSRRLRSEPISLKSALEIAIQVASALQAAHNAGIVHRDIKLENVMIRPDGVVKLLDFGIAKLTEKTREPIDEEAATAIKSGTSPGMIVGTAAYMSPEQARGKQVDARTDIFSFGVVLYEMLTARHPFEGENALDVIGSILHKEPVPIPRLLPGIPQDIERLVNKTLRKNREERYQTAADLLIDLKDARQELDLQSRLERTASSTKGEPATQIITATTAGAPHTTSSAEYLVSEITKHRRGFGALLIVVLLSLIGAGYWLLGNRAATAKQIESIAVMPFVNESGNAEVEYLSDGMTETLISSLSQLPNLNVKARSSVFRYKGKEIDLQKIAQELKVQAILTGRVVQRAEQLTLSLELVDTRTENVIWSEQYNRKQADLVSLQSEIARDVSTKLKTKLSGADEQKLAKNYTANPEAYQLYLKGRFYWNKRTVDGLKQAAEYFKQSIEKDPAFALAYSGLADAYVLFSNYSVAPPKDSMPKAKAAALKALELDDSLAEPHAALGVYLSAYAWDQAAAEREIRRAIELKPNYATAYHWLGNVLAFVKRAEEAIAAARRAEELDPLSVIISADTGFDFIMCRRYDEAIAQCQRTLMMDPNFYYAHYLLGWAYYKKGMYQEAIAECRKSVELNESTYGKSMLILSLSKSAGRAEAIKLRDQLKSESARSYVPNYFLALASIALGEKDEAFAALERDFAERSPSYSWFAADSLLDDLRDDPRFADLVRRVGLAKMD